MSKPAALSFGLSDVEILDKELRYDGFLKVDKLRLKCRLFEGGWSREFQREVLRREPGVGVLLYDPHLDKVLMVEQFRVGCIDDNVNGPWALELVAGLLESGETSEDVARREVLEEAGVTAGRLLRLFEYYNSPGGSSEKITVFCAAFDAGKAGGVFGVEDEAENIRVTILDRAEALAAMERGRINNAMSLIALQWLQLHLAEVRKLLVAPGMSTGR